VGEQQELDPRVGKHLEPGERIRVTAAARDIVLAVTDRRMGGWYAASPRSS
jgi:hypothetical protein